MAGRIERLLAMAGVALLIAGCGHGVAGHPGAADPPNRPGHPGIAATRIADTRYPVTGSEDGLAAFFRDLHGLESGRLAELRILQLGDSHTAADIFSGRLRARFQARFGDAGRGFMPPGLAYVGLRQKEVTVTQAGSWRIENSLTAPAAGPYGLTGFLAISRRSGAAMAVSPVGSNPFDLATIEYLQHPGGGRFEIRLDGTIARTVSTNGPAGHLGHLALEAAGGAHRLEIVARSPGIAIVGWGIQRRTGILLDSFGVVSATVELVDRWSPAIIRAEIQALRPSLVILAYGTNEGFHRDLDPLAYAGDFRRILAMIRRFAPQASILVVGPPDGQRLAAACRNDPVTATGDCRWTTPPTLAVVRRIEASVAAAQHTGFWDWSRLMTGPHGIDDWVNATPPLAREDHVHFTLAGYELAADTLFDNLMDAYAVVPDVAVPRRSVRP